jgi:hypothetical protein
MPQLLISAQAGIVIPTCCQYRKNRVAHCAIAYGDTGSPCVGPIESQFFGSVKNKTKRESKRHVRRMKVP